MLMFFDDCARVCEALKAPLARLNSVHQCILQARANEEAYSYCGTSHGQAHNITGTDIIPSVAL
jgi:hypothetical protein